MDVPEIEVICSNCSYPTVSEYDESGAVIGFREEPDAPQTEEEALAQGWFDHGLGLNCPRCSLSYFEDLARDEAQGIASGAHNDIGEIVDLEILKNLVPGVSDETLAIFVRLFRHDRLNKYRAKAGLPLLEPIEVPVPRDEQQAVEILRVTQCIEKLKEEKYG